MTNAELKAGFAQIIDALEGIEAALTMLLEEQERARERAIAGDLVRHARATPGLTAWPWTPDTVSQGFLAGRWLRRDGNVYGNQALRGIKGPNSPIRGGDDDQAKIDVPSGAPRV